MCYAISRLGYGELEGKGGRACGPRSIGIPSQFSSQEELEARASQMPYYLISDTHEWINESDYDSVWT